MDKLFSKKWWKCAGTRAIKTMAQTVVACITTAVVMSDVNWAVVGSTAAVAGIASLCTSLAGLPEMESEDADRE